jgi:hypothetical protein
MKYKFPKDIELMASVMAHFPNWGLEIISLTVDEDFYYIQTNELISEEQLEHLSLEFISE